MMKLALFFGCKRILLGWLQALERNYADRLLPVDLETSHIWGELTAAAQKVGGQRWSDCRHSATT